MNREPGHIWQVGVFDFGHSCGLGLCVVDQDGKLYRNAITVEEITSVRVSCERLRSLVIAIGAPMPEIADDDIRAVKQGLIEELSPVLDSQIDGLDRTPIARILFALEHDIEHWTDTDETLFEIWRSRP